MEFLCRWYLELWMPSYRASWRIWGSPFPLLATDHAMAIHSHSHPWQIPHDTPGWPRRILHGATLTISWQRHLARSQFPSIGMPMHAVYAVYAVYAISIYIYIYISYTTQRSPGTYGTLTWSEMVWHGLTWSDQSEDLEDWHVWGVASHPCQCLKTLKMARHSGVQFRSSQPRFGNLCCD